MFGTDVCSSSGGYPTGPLFALSESRIEALSSNLLPGGLWCSHCDDKIPPQVSLTEAVPVGRRG